VQSLLDHGELARSDIAQWLGVPVERETDVLEPYAQRWEIYQKGDSVTA